MRASAFLSAAAGLFLAVASAGAQAQMAISAGQPHGVIGIFPEFAQLEPGCPAGGRAPFPPHAVIDAENVCEPAKWRVEPAPSAACPGRSVPVLGIRFQGHQDWILSESIALSSRYFHVRLFGTLEDAHGERREVAAIKRLSWCADTTATPPAAVLPAAACREPRQFAVAFDYGTPFNNKILTNGFSFHLRVAGRPPASFDVENAAEHVLSSFGRALTIWTAALQDNDPLLTPTIRTFLRSRTSTSAGGYTLLTPPQVVRLRCPHTAVFVVELNFGGDETFPSRSLFLTLAKAKLEGRTIALNMRDVDCFATMTKFEAGQYALKDERCVNLLPILTHELGHAFGIGHIADGQGRALMNPVLSNHATVPTALDVSALVAVLERSVQGARPGELQFRDAPALQAPPEWSIRRR